MSRKCLRRGTAGCGGGRPKCSPPSAAAKGVPSAPPPARACGCGIGATCGIGMGDSCIGCCIGGGCMLGGRGIGCAGRNMPGGRREEVRGVSKEVPRRCLGGV